MIVGILFTQYKNYRYHKNAFRRFIIKFYFLFIYTMTSKKHMLIESIIRIFFLTLFMTSIVTYWKLWFDQNYFINWMKNWWMVALIAYIFMCFIVRPLILDKLQLQWKKRQILGMLLLVVLFTFIFSYRFDRLNIVYILRNFVILLLIVLPVGMLIAWPLAKISTKMLFKK